MSEVTLINDNCFDYFKTVADHSIDFIFTDPPYLFNRGGGRTAGTDANAIGGKSELYKFGNKMMEDMADFDKPQIYELLDESNRMCKKMHGYYFCNETALQYYLSWATEHNYKYNIIVLNKTPFIMNRNKYATNCEYLVRIVPKSGVGIKILDYDKSDNDISWIYSVQDFPKISEKMHPAEKPLNIIEGVLKLNTETGDVVLDPFMGSGSVGVMCKSLGIDYIGVEKDLEFYELAKERIANGTTYRFVKNKVAEEDKGFHSATLF